MKKSNKNVGDARYIVNLISGACTMSLIEKLFSSSGKISDMDDIYFALVALVDTDRIGEAFHMIRGMFSIADMEWRRSSYSWKSRKRYRNVLCRNLSLTFMM